MTSKPTPLKGKQHHYDIIGNTFYSGEDIRSAVEWAEHEMLHTPKNRIDILYEAFEDVMTE